MLIDTHSHVNFKDFQEDFAEVIERAKQKNVVMINVGSQISTSRRAVELAKDNPLVFAAVGLHPIQLLDQEVEEEGVVFKTRAEKFEAGIYHELATQKKVVAIGEVGLDYYHVDASDKKNKTLQLDALNEQIDLANKVNLPLIIHCRGSRSQETDAYLDLIELLKHHKPKKGGVMHSLTAPWSLAEQFLAEGFYIGFNGITTFDKTGRLSELVANTPLDRILTETDCPWLTPEPFRGKRNEPIYVEYVAQKISQIRNISFDEVALATTKNAKKLFDLAV